MEARTATSEMPGPEQQEYKAVGKAPPSVGKGGVLLAGLVLILALVLQACSVSASTANIREATMALDGAGKDPTTELSPSDQTFYALAEVANAPEETTVKAVWTAVDVEGQEPNLKIDESTTKVDGGGTLTFEMTNEGPWPLGRYEVLAGIRDAHRVLVIPSLLYRVHRLR